MKYQLNRKPRNSVVPVIELVLGQTGRIQHVGIYDRESFIHTSDGNGESVRFAGKECRLTDIARDLWIFASVNGYPLEELKEILELEKEYRSSIQNNGSEQVKA